MDDPQRPLSAELHAMSRRQELSAHLVKQGELKPLLQAILAAAAELTGTDKGNVQIYDATTRKLRIVVHQGLGRRLVEHFAEGGWAASCTQAASNLSKRGVGISTSAYAAPCPARAALHTGMRKNEILGLTWERVDFSRGVLRLEQTKSGR